MKIVTLVTAVSAGALVGVTGCQNSGHASAEAYPERPVMTATAAPSGRALVATRETEWVSSPVDPVARGTLKPGDRVYVDFDPRQASYQEGSYTENANGGVNGAPADRAIHRTSEMDEGVWRPAKTPDGKTIYIHRRDFRAE